MTTTGWPGACFRNRVMGAAAAFALSASGCITSAHRGDAGQSGNDTAAEDSNDRSAFTAKAESMMQDLEARTSSLSAGGGSHAAGATSSVSGRLERDVDQARIKLGQLRTAERSEWRERADDFERAVATVQADYDETLRGLAH